MTDHISINVSNPEASITFYVVALEPLGYCIAMEYGPVVGMGTPLPNAPENASIPLDPQIVPAESPTPCHVAASVSSAEQVDAFYWVAIAAGSTDNGEPGKRPHYHPGYYAAFILNPDGNNLEAVFYGN